MGLNYIYYIYIYTIYIVYIAYIQSRNTFNQIMCLKFWPHFAFAAAKHHFCEWRRLQFDRLNESHRNHQPRETYAQIAVKENYRRLMNSYPLPFLVYRSRHERRRMSQPTAEQWSTESRTSVKWLIGSRARRFVKPLRRLKSRLKWLFKDKFINC